MSQEEIVNQKIMREAEILLGNKNYLQGDPFDRLDALQDTFKQTMKSQFQTSFVSSGNVQTTKKEATITFAKKNLAEKETIAMDQF